MVGLQGLQKIKADLEQAGQTEAAQQVQAVIDDYSARIDRLGTSLDVDEGQRRDGMAADDLISLAGDVQVQLDTYPLSRQDRLALQNFQAHSQAIAHYGDEDAPLVNAQDFKRLLGQNLQWFNQAAPVQPPASPGSDSGLGMDL